MDQMEPVSVESVVKQTLELPRSEQRRVTDILSALVSPGQGAVPDVEPLAEGPWEPDVIQWLESITDLSAWNQLQLLDDAVNRTDPGHDTEAVLQARKVLLENNPPLAVRASVTRLFEERPAMAAMGILGLCFGVIALGRGFFKLIF